MGEPKTCDMCGEKTLVLMAQDIWVQHGLWSGPVHSSHYQCENCDEVLYTPEQARAFSDRVKNAVKNA
jgi:hypothetical protein